MTLPPKTPPPRRGALANPHNRFESTRTEREVTDPDWGPDGEVQDERQVRTQFFPDTSKSILTQNDSPDIGFEFSANPYRGCEHGCSYCYARPTHETLAMGAGIDFESKTMVKEVLRLEAATLRRTAPAQRAPTHVAPSAPASGHSSRCPRQSARPSSRSR